MGQAIPILWPGQLTFMARALLGETNKRYYGHGVPRQSSAGERTSLPFPRLLRAPAR